MKTFISVILVVMLVSSCDSETPNCESGAGDKVQGIEAQIHFDDRFNQLVFSRHVPRTIDSFETFIPCNAPESLEAGSIVSFDGIVTKLPKEKEPFTVVGAEEFFVVRLTAIDKDPE
jgi:hypothetical protein